MKRWWRRALRGYGIFLPFSAVVCPRYVKAIRITGGADVEVSIERTLVYLEAPEPADLWDLVPAADGECLIHPSPDARELLHTATARGTIVHWHPNTPIVPYGLYIHRHGWTSPGPLDEAALYTEFRCDTRTGVAVLELSTTKSFEAAVAFRWPGWRRLLSSETLVKYALEQLEMSQGQQPEVGDDSAVLRWTFVNPRVGERYACVAFHAGGKERWHARLSANTLRARVRRLVRSMAAL